MARLHAFYVWERLRIGYSSIQRSCVEDGTDCRRRHRKGRRERVRPYTSCVGASRVRSRLCLLMLLDA